MAIRSRNKPSAEFSLASISDIVFLLLIFFMVTSTFASQAGVKIDYPKSESRTPSKADNSATITKEGTYLWNNQLVQKEQLPNLIKSVLTDPNTDNKVITLRVDKEVTYENSMIVVSNVAKYNGSLVIATDYGKP
jgi:biopolymer transport protein ExbD